MNSKLSNMRTSEALKEFLLLCVGVAAVIVLASLTRTYSPTIWEQAKSAGNSLLGHIQTLYNAIFLPLFALDILLMCLTKDEKRMGIYQKALITLCVCFVVINATTIVWDSLDQIVSEWGGSTSGSGAEAASQ